MESKDYTLMSGEELWRSILQYAIEGKLVPQNPTDDPVSKQLEEIEAERKKLFAEGKLKKKDLVSSHIYRDADGHYFERVGKKVPVCIDDQIPFEIPESWRWLRGEFAFLPMQSEKPSSDFTYIDIDAVNNKSNKIDNPKFTRLSSAPSRASRKVHTGDVLFSMVRPYLRNIALVTDDLNDAIASTGFYVITPSCAFVSRFVFYACLSPYVVDGLNERVRGDNSPSIKTSDVLNFLFPLPPLAEQRRIVAKLDALRPVVERYAVAEQSLLALNSEVGQSLRASLLEEAIRGRLVEQRAEEGCASDLLPEIEKERKRLYEEGKLKKKDLDTSHIYKGDDGHFYERVGKKAPLCIDDQIPFDIPDSWQWVRLGSIIQLLSGQDMQPSEYNSSGLGIPYMTGASNIENGQLNVNRWTECPRSISHKGDLLLSCKGSVGKTSVNEIGGVHIARQFMALRLISGTEVYYLKCFIDSISQRLRESANGLIPGISRKTVHELLFPLPPKAEQRRIVERLDQLMAEVEKL